MNRGGLTWLGARWMAYDTGAREGSYLPPADARAFVVSQFSFSHFLSDGSLCPDTNLKFLVKL